MDSQNQEACPTEHLLHEWDWEQYKPLDEPGPSVKMTTGSHNAAQTTSVVQQPPPPQFASEADKFEYASCRAKLQKNCVKRAKMDQQDALLKNTIQNILKRGQDPK